MNAVNIVVLVRTSASVSHKTKTYHDVLNRSGGSGPKLLRGGRATNEVATL